MDIHAEWSQRRVTRYGSLANRSSEAARADSRGPGSAALAALHRNAPCWLRLRWAGSMCAVSALTVGSQALVALLGLPLRAGPWAELTSCRLPDRLPCLPASQPACLPPAYLSTYLPRGLGNVAASPFRDRGLIVRSVHVVPVSILLHWGGGSPSKRAPCLCRLLPSLASVRQAVRGIVQQTDMRVQALQAPELGCTARRVGFLKPWA